MSDERRLDVLRAIVEDHVRTSEPVGSRALLEQHALGVSAATIRNDMAVLEEEGLIQAPHTSAGRVPTDAGYRLFVDSLAGVRDLRPAERRAIRDFLTDPIDLDDVVERTARLLAALTQQVAVVQYPSLSRSVVRHVEVVPMADRLMVVLITDTGRVEQRVVSLPQDGSPADVAAARDAVNATAAGRAFAEARHALHTLRAERPLDTVLAVVVETIDAAMTEQREERVVLGGTSSLARQGGDFGASLEPVLAALEEHVVLLRLLQFHGSGNDVTVSIGTENYYHGLHSTSVVSSAYGAGEIASLGVLGPTRMDYPATMGAVRAVARYLSDLLAER